MTVSLDNSKAVHQGIRYLQHAMGLASSIGLGLALNLPGEQVVVLDGDGSVLMNLGTLTTMARYQPPNLTHIIFDNGSLLSTGGSPTHTAEGPTDLAAIARGAGIPHVALVSTPFDFVEAVADAFEGDELSVIVANVEVVGPLSVLISRKAPTTSMVRTSLSASVG